ncbi:hypothetical protein KQI52_07680 [bacterium]|nr:hypothetical protein [bacterium]
MDEAKKRELEELRKQIDPKVLERVSKAMSGGGGGGGGGAAPASTPSGGGSGGGGGRPAGRPPRSHGSSLSELKARIARREKELDLPDDPDIPAPSGTKGASAVVKPTIPKAPEGPLKDFIIYDINMMRGRQILAYMQRMGLQRAHVTGDPKRFLEALINALNSEEDSYLSIIAHVDSFPIVNAILDSDELRTLRMKMPQLVGIAKFAVYEQDRELARLTSVDARYVMNLRHEPAFNKKRIEQVLKLLHRPF